MRYWVRELGIGGVIVTVGPPLEMAVKLNMLQDMAAVPLLVSADMEHGPGQALNAGTILPYGLDNGGATRFPPLMGLGASGEERFAYELGRITALEGRAAGVHVTFSPVVDVNNNPGNPIINTRSYGADPALVSRMAAAHVRGIQDHGMLATAKHFPGHGDTGTDSHVDLPFITVDKARADSVELPPYRAAFDAGVAAVMSAHIAFPAMTGDSVPATLNARLLTGLLRDELGFDGMVFTDALDMGAIVDGWGAGMSGVLALKAGADVLLQMLPDDVPVVIDAVVDAVQRGELTESRIDASVLRILRAKEQLKLHETARVEIERMPEILGTAAHLR
ncbi:MAG: glycoside hydrolase family 3 protein, partial [Longimicrobiales bacterium]